jgi:hypothetical protein
MASPPKAMVEGFTVTTNVALPGAVNKAFLQVFKKANNTSIIPRRI